MSIHIKKHNSLILLILANTIPLFGVLFFGWDLFAIIFLYWLESAVIGFYNIFKLKKVARKGAFFIIPFFIVHYGGFMLGHLVFIFAIFTPETSSLLPSVETIINLLQLVSISLIALFISHGYSFFHNFINKKEYENREDGEQMMIPYKRIVIMHITIIVSGFLVMISGEGIIMLTILILLKTMVDIRAHTQEHALLPK